MTEDKLTVFLVWHTGFHDNDSLVGIFSTRDKAQKCLNKYTHWDQRAMRIEEEKVE